MESVNLKKASLYYLIGNLFNKGISFLTVPIFTRILSTYDYGIVTTYNSYVTILAMVLGYALHSGIRIAYIDYKEKFNEFTSSIIIFTVLSSTVLSSIVLIVTYSLKLDINLLIMVLCLIQAISTAIIQDYNYYLMMQYKYKVRTMIMILPNLISVIFSVMAMLMMTKSQLYMGKIVPTALVNLVFAFMIFVIIVYRGKLRINFEYVKYGMIISAPLIIHGIALNILSQSDRMMITWLADASQTGIYSLIYNFSMIATVITTSLEGVWVPWFLCKLKLREINVIQIAAKKYILLMTVTMVCLVMVSPEIVKLLASRSYWEGILIIPPVVLSNLVIFMYTLYVNIEHYYKKTIYVTINTVIAAILNLFLNYLFIPRFGYVAAAYTTLISYLISFILHSNYALKLEPNIYPLNTFVPYIIQVIIATVIFYIFIDIWYVRWLLMVIYFIGVCIKEKETIFKLILNIKK